MSAAELFGNVIFSYSRADAIADGVLVDLSESAEAREAGFRVPLAITRAAWAAAVEVPQGCEGFQDEAGRLWDVLWLARQAAKRQGGSRATFAVSTITTSGGRRRNVHLVLVCGPGDTPAPVLTIMLHDES